MPLAARSSAGCSHIVDPHSHCHHASRSAWLLLASHSKKRILALPLRSHGRRARHLLPGATESDGAASTPESQLAANAATTSAAAASSSTTSAPQATILSKPSVVRQLLTCSSASEVLDILLQDDDLCSSISIIPTPDCDKLILAALERGNLPLAMSVYKEMCSQRQPFATAASAIHSLVWPKVTLDVTRSTILGLAKATEVESARSVLQAAISRGVPQSKDLDFGMIVPSPLNPSKPLTVVQPREGVKNVGDALSRYEYEVFSGNVTSCSTEALNVTPNPLLSAAAAIGIWKKPQVQAVHEFVVQAPNGMSRAFRCGTATADIPANVGDRVSVVCSPATGSNKYRKAFLTANQPGTIPGQGLLVTNHRTGASTPLLKPPPSNRQAGLPSWVLPTAIVLAGSDAATWLIDPSLPLLIATGAAVTASTAIAGQTLLVPELKRIPNERLKAQSNRQQLLLQHSALGTKCDGVLHEANETVYYLAQIWQLLRKMSVVTNSRAYEARSERLTRIQLDLEQRIAKQLELLDGYSDVIRKIEIEIELEEQLDLTNDELEKEIARLEELASLREEWTFQAEAADEVEKLLRATA